MNRPRRAAARIVFALLLPSLAGQSQLVPQSYLLRADRVID